MHTNSHAASGLADAAAAPSATPGVARRPVASGPHWPALDGLRGIAVMAVITYHVGALAGGYLGVDVFFVLSGFLITTLLVREWDARAGQVSFRAFYARRALRLFPALGCVIAAAVLIAGSMALTGGSAGRAYAWTTLDAVPFVVAFAGNWVRAFASSSPAGSLGILGHTWSLAVEEQFYLLWPALLALLMRSRASRTRLAAALALLGVGDMAYRGYLAHLGYGLDRMYYGTDSHCDGLLIGCAIAFWLTRRPATPGGGAPEAPARPSRPAQALTWCATVVLAGLFISGGPQGNPASTSAAVLAAGVILATAVTGAAPARLTRLLASPILTMIGRRSYGLYLWQYLLLALTEAVCAQYPGVSLSGPWSGRLIFAVALATGVAATFAVAELSYKYVELPALRRKRRFRPPAPATAVTATASTAPPASSSALGPRAESRQRR
jgi:peptidoglycan/LPS O-acetylase OafA/YrhL